MSGAQTAIEVRGLSKSFRIPSHRKDTLKERVVKPLARSEYRELHALRDVSFEIERGEFFGVVGRNGSGKSTLLKLLASIYRADAGEIRVAGSIAPFIELAVGFNLEFSAYENSLLNGVMMGLTRKEAERRFDEVIEFAELEEFGDLKLKNYSSGMLTRLAFSLMVQVDADVMLIDEVLAVGDASFQRKCGEVFEELRGKRTIVFVTHDMTAVERYCHRAMLIDHGEIDEIGEPLRVARSYVNLNASPISAEGRERRLQRRLGRGRGRRAPVHPPPRRGDQLQRGRRGAARDRASAVLVRRAQRVGRLGLHPPLPPRRGRPGGPPRGRRAGAPARRRSRTRSPAASTRSRRPSSPPTARRT